MSSVSEAVETQVNVDSSSYEETQKVFKSPAVPAVPAEIEKMIRYMFRYSFSATFHKNIYLTSLTVFSYAVVASYMDCHPKEKITMTSLLKVLSPMAQFQLNSINRKKEERLAFEAVIVLAFMKSKHAVNVELSKEAFERKYPQFCGSEVYLEERNLLFDFCNCVRFVHCLIPPKNNKEHILDLVSRLTEGFSVRRVTGTGMTKETFRRYEIIHVEGNLKKVARPERRVDPMSKPPKIPKKRGRPLSIRV
jgi:hypothetical protein